MRDDRSARSEAEAVEMLGLGREAVGPLAVRLQGLAAVAGEIETTIRRTS